VDIRIPFVNSLTALTPRSTKAPIYFDTDRKGIERALESLSLASPAAAIIVRSAETLFIADMEISEALLAEAKAQPHKATVDEPCTLDVGEHENSV
jgi:hypothetical protein